MQAGQTHRARKPRARHAGRPDAQGTQATDSHDPRHRAPPHLPSQLRALLKQRLAPNGVQLLAAGVVGVPDEEAGAVPRVPAWVEQSVREGVACVWASV